MKKFITLLVLVLAFTANAMSQITTAGKPETIASFRMGNRKQSHRSGREHASW